MNERTSKPIIYIFFASLIFCVTVGLSAQTPPAATVPTQFATAHTAFLSNAGAPSLANREKEGATMAYESISGALVKDRHYKLTPVPSDAELAFEVSIQATDQISKGDSVNSGYLRLAVYDVKTHCLLWNIDEPVRGAFRASSFQKNIDEASGKIIADLHALISGKQP